MDTQQKATQIIVNLDEDHDFDLTEKEAIVLFSRILKCPPEDIPEDDDDVCEFVDMEADERVEKLLTLMTKAGSNLASMSFNSNRNFVGRNRCLLRRGDRGRGLGEGHA